MEAFANRHDTLDINLATELFSEGFQFFLPSCLTQDALENVFPQVRRKAEMKPTAFQAKRALKLICVSQFIQDIENSNYASESDCHLLRMISLKKPPSVDKQSSTNNQLLWIHNWIMMHLHTAHLHLLDIQMSLWFWLHKRFAIGELITFSKSSC